jgi:hypothetical protein
MSSLVMIHANDRAKYHFLVNEVSADWFEGAKDRTYRVAPFNRTRYLVLTYSHMNGLPEVGGQNYKMGQRQRREGGDSSCDSDVCQTLKAERGGILQVLGEGMVIQL